MEDSRLKEVYFGNYCESCKYEQTDETDDPCNECLSYPENVDSHKPIHYKEKV